MKVLCITATKNRHAHLEKLVRCFLEQDYEDKHTLLIFNNAKEMQAMKDYSTLDKRIVLINNHLHSESGRAYTNLGEIYNDTLRFVDRLEQKFDIVNHMDDDDFFLPDHISKGVEGYKRGGKLAYKPAKSWYRQKHQTTLQSNNLEPSIFVNYDHLKHNGYWDRNVDLHLKWLDVLIKSHQIHVDPKGKATFVYDWSGEIPTFKTSGNPNDAANFQNYSKRSTDIGDQEITPISKEAYKQYLNKLNLH